MKINFKTLAVGLLIAVAASVSVGAATPGYGVGTANDDVVLKASQTTGYNTYIRIFCRHSCGSYRIGSNAVRRRMLF